MSNDFIESYSFREMICDSCQNTKADATFDGMELTAGDCLSIAHQYAKNGNLNEAAKSACLAMITLQDKSGCVTCIEKINKCLEDGNLADIYLSKF